MKATARNKKKKDRFECYVCGEEAVRSQMCCGHPMIEIMPDEYVPNCELLSELERV